MLLSWLRRRRREGILSEPVPPDWLDVLARNVPLTRHLTPAGREHLLADARIFIAEKNWEGCGGLVLTDEIRVTIAGHACLLLLAVGHDYFERVRSILVYPSAYANPDGVAGPDGVVREGVAVLGEAWRDGPVVLAWDAVRAGGRDESDGRNVVLHEFAHQLDYLDGVADGVPPVGGPAALAEWRAATGTAFANLTADIDAGRPHLLDEYGATNPAEFFAVATECFFEQPRELRTRHPRLFGVLREYYRQDPAARLDGDPQPAGLWQPFRGSRADAKPSPLAWPDWVTIWEIQPGVPRSVPTRFIDKQVTWGIAFLVTAAVWPLLNPKQATYGEIFGVGFGVPLLACAAWMYAAVRWVDRRRGWAGGAEEAES